jgi:hypothetical protein
MVIFLLPTQILFSPSPVTELIELTLSFAYNISSRATQKTHFFYCCSPTVALSRICCLATGSCAQKQSWYIHPFLGRCIATALHFTVLYCTHVGLLFDSLGWCRKRWLFTVSSMKSGLTGLWYKLSSISARLFLFLQSAIFSTVVHVA